MKKRCAPNALTPDDTFPTSTRFGSFLPSIPPCNRVGDYVHCNCRAVNMFLKRVVAMVPATGVKVAELVHRLEARVLFFSFGKHHFLEEVGLSMTADTNFLKIKIAIFETV
jgi:hypothetical protein